MNPQEKSFSPEKKELLARMLARAGHRPRTDRIIPENGKEMKEPQPLSAAQERMFFLDQFSGGANNYIMSIALRIHGALDVAILERALREVVRRHTVLRSVFQPVNGKDRPTARVIGESGFRLERFDLTGRDPAAREIELCERASRLDRTPLDLVHGPPLRASLLKVDREDHALLINLHHIASDGWSLNLIAREASALYSDYLANRPSRLPEPPIQYADFARWERERAGEERTRNQIHYWREKLRGLPGRIFPGRQATLQDNDENAGGTVPLCIGADLRTRLETLARGEQATTFMVLLAVFELLLYRTTGEKDFAVGAPIAQRRLPETENAVGLFLNTLALRATVNPRDSFRDFLKSVRATTLEAFEHQDIPFDSLVRELAPRRGPLNNPFFQTIFMLQNAPPPGSGWRLEGLEVSPQPFDLTTTRLPLELHLWEQPDKIDGFLLYDRNLFSPAFMKTMAERFMRLLETLPAQPDRSLETIQVLRDDGPERESFSPGTTRRTGESGNTTEPRTTAAPGTRDAGEIDADLERALCEIFSEVLDRRPVRPGDGFFELGGHSLIAMQLVSRIRERSNARVLIRDIFREPTPRGLARLLNAAKPAPAAAPKAEQAISRAGQDPSPPLSYAQESLWFLDRSLQRPEAYNMPLLLKLRGRFTPAHHDALEDALGAIVNRHATLRLRFSESNGVPRAEAPSRPAFSLSVTGGPDSPPPTIAEVFREAERPFALHESSFRAGLYRFAKDEHLLLINLHHSAADGWSLGILTRELKTRLENLLAGLPSLELEPPPRYGDFAGRERAGDWSAELRYWRRKLAGAKPTALPADRPPPSEERRLSPNLSLSAIHGSAGREYPALPGTLRFLSDNPGRQVNFKLPPALTRAVREFAAREQATPFMVLLAAFQSLLYRYTGQPDVIVGTPLANREKAFEETVGLFVNMLAVRTRFAPGTSFEKILRRSRRGLLADFARSSVPFERLVAAMNPRREAAHNPLFRTVFAVNPPDMIPERLGDLRVDLVETPVNAAKFDLEFYLTEQPDEFAGNIIFRGDIYRSATMERLAANYRRLLEELIRNPGRPAADISLPGDEENELYWPATAGHGSRRSVPGLLERQARKFPERIALESAGTRVTYRDLDERAARLASVLREHGLGPGDFAAVRMRDFIDRTIVLLAVLKTGATYVPLKPDVEHEDLRYIVKDSGAKLLIRDGQPGATRGLELPVLDSASLFREAGAPGQDAKPAGAPPGPGAPLALIYPDRSADAPEPGAQSITHETAVQLGRDGDLIALSSTDGVACDPATDAFAGALELWAVLLRGARLIAIDADSFGDANRLGRELRERHASILFAPTGAIARLAKNANNDEDFRAFGSLRCLFFDGSRCDPQDLRRLRRSAPGLELIRMHRPAAFPAPLFCRIRYISPRTRTLPFGRPVAGYRARVLGPDASPVPRGGPGELCLLPPNSNESLIRSGQSARVDPAGRIAALYELPETRMPRAAFERSSAAAAPAVFRDLHEAHLEETRSRLGEIWRRLLDRDQVKTSDNFFELGGHSLLAVRLLAEIRGEFKRDLPISALFSATTIEAQARRILEDTERTVKLPLVQIRSRGRGRPLFLVHPGGGSPLCYIPLARHLHDRPVFGFQARGLERGETPATSVREMAVAYVAAMKTVQPRGPYLLAGWSAGGMIAFEMACLLEAAGEKVDLLALLDASVPDHRTPAGPAGMIASLLGMAANVFRIAPPRDLRDLRHLFRMAGFTLPERILSFDPARLVELGNAMIEAVKELPRFWPVYRDLFLAVHRYTPGVYPGGAALFLSQEQIFPGTKDALIRTLRKYTRGDVEIIHCRGNHMTLLDESNAAALARQLNDRMYLIETGGDKKLSAAARPFARVEASPPVSSEKSPAIPERLPAVFTDRTAHMARWFSNMEYSLAIELDGRLEADRLRRALRLCMDVHPVLGCDYVDGLFRPSWARRTDLDSIDFCEILPCGTEAERTAGIESFTTREAPVERGPSLRARLMRGENDTLCLKLNHIVTDGRGARQIMKTVADLYRRLGTEPNYVAHPDPTPRDWKALGASVGFDGWLRSLDRFRTDQRDLLRNAAGPWRFPGKPAPGPYRRAFLFESIDGEDLRAIQDYRRRLKVGLNEVIIAAYFRALHGVIRPPEDTEMRIAMAVDLRNYLSPPPRNSGVSVSNLAAFCYPGIGDSIGSSIDATARRCSRELAALKNEMMGLGDWAAYQLMPESLLSMARIPAALLEQAADNVVLPPVFSGMPLYEQGLNFGSPRTRSVRIFAHLLRPPNFMVTMTLFNGSLTLGCSFCEISMNPATVAALLRDMKEEALSRTARRSPRMNR